MIIADLKPILSPTDQGPGYLKSGSIPSSLPNLTSLLKDAIADFAVAGDWDHKTSKEILF